MLRWLLFVSVVSLLVGVTAGSGSAGSRWVIRDLGTLGGPYSEAVAINARGQIVGESDTKVKDKHGDPISHAFVWQQGKLTDLGALPGLPFSTAVAINGRGQVIGYSYRKNEYGDVVVKRGFLWQDGKMRDLGTLGGSQSNAYAINDRSEVVGEADTKAKVDGLPVSHAFLWQNAKMRDLGTLGGHWSSASDINERGEVVGGSYTAKGADNVFLWQNGKMIDLGTTAKPRNLRIYSALINERGQIAGYYGDDGGRGYFFWQKGKMIDLGLLNGGCRALRSSCDVAGINDRGQVVGTADVKTRNGDIAYRVVLWQNGNMVDLGEGFAYAINNSGQIVGEGFKRSGLEEGSDSYAFLWQDGKKVDLGSGCRAEDINERGQIVGTRQTMSGNHAVLWTLKPAS